MLSTVSMLHMAHEGSTMIPSLCMLHRLSVPRRVSLERMNPARLHTTRSPTPAGKSRTEYAEHTRWCLPCLGP